MKSPRRGSATRQLLCGALACVLGTACSSGGRSGPAPTPLDSTGIEPRSSAVVGTCTSGEVQDCSVTLGVHEGVLNCYRGQQVCAEGVWGSCGNGEMSSLPAPGEELRGTSGLHFLAVTGAEGCADNPCDPSCLEIAAADGEDTSSFSGDLGSYDWQTGTLLSYPNGLVSKGLNEPCETGSDCQFDTRCEYPVSTGCAHSKCATGAALEPSCDSCVADICAVDASCCPTVPVPPPVCAHDPCLLGAALSASCDPCVTAICLDRPSCCSGTWDASCRAAVVSTCGNICQCQPGEVAYGGGCYIKDETDRSWTAARTTCQARGTGWDLLSVGDSAENDFVNSQVIDDSETWIGFTDGNGIGTDTHWRWASGSPTGAWNENSTGAYGDVETVALGSSWKYLANNVAPAASWNTVGFNDSAWGTGNAQLGFGDNDEATSFTRNGPSYYFRRTFTLAKLPSAAALETLYDDGFVAYVNGTEVRRNNVTNATHTAFANSTNKENDVDTSTFAVTPFVIGTNVIAVLVKNGSSTNSDLSFDAKLTLTYAPDRPIAYGSTWSYYAASPDPGATWASPSFNDAGWASGAGQLGFGETDQATSFTKTGASYYFRKKFTLAELVNDASLSVLYDDGFVAYLNGTEVLRRNVTDVTHSAFATAGADNDQVTASIGTAAFRVGENVLAVQVKNLSGNSNDLSFDAQLDLQLSGNAVYENFGSGEPGNQDCARYDGFRTGSWGDKACNQQTDSVCEGPASRMAGSGGTPLSGSWTAIGYGASWKYRANTTDPGSSWNSPGFADAGWSTGVGQFGYGDNDEATTLSVANPSYYFRKTLNVPTAISDATLSLVFDDGFVAYVNGFEVARRNVSSNGHSAYATTASGDNETLTLPISKTPFVVGSNTIAVVVKNSSSASNDISFDLKLDVTLCGAGGCPPEPTWSQSCVDKVASVCDAKCDTRSPPASTGQCVPWFPGETDPTCSGIDLSVGVTCDDSIPVCNHGTATAPAGVRIVHFPGNSQQYPSCSPNLSHPQLAECFTTSPIPPGQCINLNNCPGLSGNREIMVNPPGAAHVNECSCRDNWSLYSGGSCGEPTCDGGSSIATLTKKPVDIIIVIDNSGSMQGEIAQVQQRINRDFAQIIENSGIDYRVIMMSRYGNINTAVGGSDYPICVSSPLGGHDCHDPINQGVRHNPPHFYHFSTDVGSTDPLCRLLQGYSNGDELSSDRRSWTPVAPNGYKDLLRPEAFKAFLVITDDHVNCSYGGYTFNDLDSTVGGQLVASTFDAALRGLSSAQFGTASSRNYVFHSIVAMSEFVPGTAPWPPTQPINTGKCTPGSEAPGTGYQGLSVLTGGLRYPTCRNNDFNAIFQAVAQEVVEGASVSCSIELGHGREADPAKTSVRYTPGRSGSAVTLQRVANAAACVNNAYYYATPTTITLCPSTCTTVQADLQGSLGVEVGCIGAGGYETKVLSETYESECADDTRVQWGFFTYDTTTPSDSNVRFRIRTANTEAGLATATWVDLATAHASPNTQRCSMAGPAPCPIDLYNVLGGGSAPAVHHNFAQVDVTLTPSSDGTEPASVQGWQLNYSCPFAQ
ncbi:MAG TPA: C-type lectin domain-containing protein [Polyangiaceae bacterium]|nr:C-type lectin domain-containing protein [Polyangiaceae bacterium]